MRNKVDVNVRFYEPGDDEDIVELLKKTFPKWSSFNDPLSLWRWKYIDTPYNSTIVVVDTGEKIVGCSHSIVFNAKLGSELTSIRYDDDTAVDTEYRRRGISNKMYDKAKQALPEVHGYYTTTNPILINQAKKKQYIIMPFPATRMVRTQNLDLQLKERPMKNSHLVKLGYLGLKTLNQIKNHFRPPVKSIGEFQIAEVSEFDEGIDSFWGQIIDDYDFILEKSHEYLNWRYADNDRGSHYKIQAVNGEEILGYAVTGYRKDSSEGYIEDLLAQRDRLDVADALLSHACRHLDGMGVNTLYYQLWRATLTRSYLREMGS